MDMRILERNAKLHRAIAEAFKASFFRVWQRPLTPGEVCAIESVPLCSSFMRLEVIGRDIEESRTVEDANEAFALICSEVAAYRGEALGALLTVTRDAGLMLPCADDNLLKVEERLLAHLKRD